MDDLPPDLAQPVTDLASAISTIEAQVQRLQSAPWAELCKGLTPLEVARRERANDPRLANGLDPDPSYAEIIHMLVAAGARDD